MKFFIVLFAIVAVASAGHYAKYIHIPGDPPIPSLEAKPLALHGNDHTTRIKYHGSYVGHPHLVGVEVFKPAPNYEPSWTNVAAHGYGHE
ncbi:hypothetical protein PUN28_006712 [Cardiocondyla obscurior]|uniref:Uncharacterized protein n=1 Tax=Cardiocondyla obscurior TaxID=286306 RepID=A0AAW2FZZ0_9HYME